MFKNFRNPMKKFGPRKNTPKGGTYVYSELQYGATEDMLREMRKLNKVARKLGDRHYFVWPVGGLINNSVLVVGRKIGY